MDSSFWWLAVSAGFNDTSNPNVLSAGAVVLLLYFWLRRRGINPRKPLLVFVGAVIGCNIIFSTGLLGLLISDARYHLAIRAVFWAAGVVFVISSGMCFVQWLQLRKGRIAPVLDQGNLKKAGWLTVLTMVAAGFLAALGNDISPMDPNILALSNQIILPGRSWAIWGILATYTVFEFLPVLIVVLTFPNPIIAERMRYLVSAAISLCAAISIFWISY